MTETLLLAVRLRAESAIAFGRSAQANAEDKPLAGTAWIAVSEQLEDMADQLESSDSQPASTVTDAAIVAQARLVRELQREAWENGAMNAEEIDEAWAAVRDEQRKLDAMLKASEVTA